MMSGYYVRKYRLQIEVGISKEVDKRTFNFKCDLFRKAMTHNVMYDF